MQTEQVETASVAAVVVVYNSGAEARACVSSCLLQDKANTYVIAVDNGSTDDSAEVLLAAFGSNDRFELLRVHPNRGFSGGANAGMHRALETDAAFVWLLTDDVELDSAASRRLLDAMEQNQEAGVGGPYIYFSDSPNKIYYGGGVLGRGGADHEYGGCIDDGSLSAAPARDTGYVTGAAMFFRREALVAAGLMDEDFWLYWEDVDLSWRVREAGWRAIVVPSAKALHDVTPPTDASLAVRRRYQVRNYLLFCRRHRIQGLAASVFALSRQLPSLVRSEGMRSIGAVAAGIGDFLMGRTGRIGGSW